MDRDDAEIIKELKERGYTQPKKTLRDIKKGLEEARVGKVSRVQLRKL